ncbi:MAG: hypothetical protein C0508_02715 [Cyanobacteria bacterium PR.023]|nr:hypothetical protein [Cyanobacteria bacterium PR.023]
MLPDSCRCRGLMCLGIDEAPPGSKINNLDGSNTLMLVFPACPVNKRESPSPPELQAREEKDEGWHPHASLLPQRFLDLSF